MICVFLADGFEDMEAIVTVDILKRANYTVKTVGIGKTEITSASGVKMHADMKDDDLVIKDVCSVVLPGGMPGSVNLRRSSVVCEALTYCMENKKLIAAICAAPFILGELGFLKNKEATCYPGFESKLIGAKKSFKSVCVDDNIITAKGPGVAMDFAFKIIEYISGKDLAMTIRKEMQCL